MKKRISPVVLLLVLLAVYAYSASPEEELYEASCAIRALTRAGVTYGDFSTRMSELVVREDRYVRSGGTDSDLLRAVNHYKKSHEKWRDKIRDDLEYGKATDLSITQGNTIQMLWQFAEDNLEVYEENRISKKPSSPKGTKEK